MASVHQVYAGWPTIEIFMVGDHEDRPYALAHQ